MPQNNSTGFDAFFRSITESPEFQKSVRKDPSVDSMESLEKSLLEMQHDVNKASEIMRDFDKNFGTEAARDIGANTTSAVSPPKT